MASPPSNCFFMVDLPERLFVARSVSRLNAQGHWQSADINSGAALSSDDGQNATTVKIPQELCLE
jgi:hypothetical protein